MSRLLYEKLIHDVNQDYRISVKFYCICQKNPVKSKQLKKTNYAINIYFIKHNTLKFISFISSNIYNTAYVYIHILISFPILINKRKIRNIIFFK